ncbi:hypothetical protein D9M68_726260 [compost metagenome]
MTGGQAARSVSKLSTSELHDRRTEAAYWSTGSIGRAARAWAGRCEPARGRTPGHREAGRLSAGKRAARWRRCGAARAARTHGPHGWGRRSGRQRPGGRGRLGARRAGKGTDGIAARAARRAPLAHLLPLRRTGPAGADLHRAVRFQGRRHQHVRPPYRDGHAGGRDRGRYAGQRRVDQCLAAGGIRRRQCRRRDPQDQLPGRLAGAGRHHQR